MRQLQIAWQIYADVNCDWLVPNWLTWDGYNYLTSSSTRESWVYGSAHTNASTADIRKGALWPHTRNEAVYRCPSDRTVWRYYGSTNAPRPFNVAISLAMHGGENGRTGSKLNPAVLARLGEVRRPTALFTFMDRQEREMTSGAFVWDYLQSGQWAAMPGQRDRNCGANVAFADGHVEFHKWKYLGRVRKGVGTVPVNAADQTDLHWVLQLIP